MQEKESSDEPSNCFNDSLQTSSLCWRNLDLESHYESQEVFKLMMRDKETITFTFGQSNSNVGEVIAVDV